MTRLEKLKELEENLYNALHTCEDKSVASIAKQYRETIKEIEEIEGNSEQTDEIAQILGDRDGKPGAVRANRA